MGALLKFVKDTGFASEILKEKTEEIKSSPINLESNL